MLKKTDIMDRVKATLADFVEDWGIDAPIVDETKLVEDLEFDSIDVIQFTVSLEKAFDNRRLGFQDLLMREGRYVDDLSVAQVSAFIETRLAAA